ncbi:HD domain-containing protein [Lentzea cavernae]|nr:HD domain-containing protein [Lentzea cavernae]
MDGLVPWATDLARSLLSEPCPSRWEHVRGAASQATLAGKLFTPVDADLLVASAVLHDIGYAPSLACTGFHPLDGAVYLEAAGAPPRLCALVAHHSYAYLEAELRGMTASLARWTDEMTPVRDALWWADMTTTPKGQATNVLDRIEEIQKRYGPDNLVAFFVRQAAPELIAAVERTEARFRTASIDVR